MGSPHSIPVTNRATFADLQTEQGCRRAFDRLLSMSDDELAQQDIAVMNLLCATGLPSSDPLDIPECLKTLDDWANYTYREVFRGFPQYLKNPDPNKGSENVYRLWAVMHAVRALSGLEKRFMSGKGIKDRHVIDDSMPPTGGTCDFKRNSQVGFIHGLLSQRCLGCCASDPVLMAAISRRLGYPVKLVLTVQHVFNRWVDENEQFNMDGSMKHIGGDEDHHYIDRWRPWRDTERAAIGKTLHVPLTPRQELAAFMFERSNCLFANHRLEDAKEACTIAHNLSPNNPAHSNELETIDAIERRRTLGFIGTPAIPATRLPSPSPPLQHSPTIQPSQPLVIQGSAPIFGVNNVKFIYKKKES